MNTHLLIVRAVNPGRATETRQGFEHEPTPHEREHVEAQVRDVHRRWLHREPASVVAAVLPWNERMDGPRRDEGTTTP